jgi:cysteine sulfinate desulfinase/cysteine desulfurase-like protein
MASLSAVIYLDHNATTPIAPEVLEAMMPCLTSEWGNPSSAYKFGSKLKGVIETAREQVAGLIGASGREVIFTSCATESNNAAILAALQANPGKRHIATSAVEHSSVLNHCKALERDGSRVTYLPVDHNGLLKLADLENTITEDTAVVSLMWANNETGVLFPVKQIAEIRRSRGVLFHCDAVQAAGKVEIDVREVQADYLSLTGPQVWRAQGSRRALRAAQSTFLTADSRRASGAESARRDGVRAADCRDGEGGGTGAQTSAGLRKESSPAARYAGGRNSRPFPHPVFDHPLPSGGRGPG